MKSQDEKLPTQRELQKIMLKTNFDEEQLEAYFFPHGQPDIELSESDSVAMWNRIIMRLRASGDWREEE